MPWTCQCTVMNADTAPACIRCGKPLKPASSHSDTWKLGAIAGVVLLGGIFGVVLAVFGSGRGSDTNAAGQTATAQTSRNTEAKSAYQESFDTSFKNSCRQSSISFGQVSRAVADNYCDCALTVFHKTHSMTEAAASCKKYIFR
jgi:hypothetical protein